MKFISYTNDGRVAIQHAALILSKLDEADTLELHTMDNAIILLKKDMTRAETRDVLQGMVRLARSMTLDAPVSYTHLDVYKRQVLTVWKMTM